jgi:Co/Zn/Cd efflux system component
VRAVSISLAVLAITAALQAVVFVLSGSVALLADLIHNGGDALTAIPLAIAFLARSERGERWGGYAVVFTIFVSASVAAYAAVDRLLHPQHLDYLGVLALAGAIGFVGNELAARVRLRAGDRLDSPALIADGHHARVDGFVSLGVVASAAVVALGLNVADPLIGLAITLLILRITWQAWQTVHADHDHAHDHDHDHDTCRGFGRVGCLRLGAVVEVNDAVAESALVQKFELHEDMVGKGPFPASHHDGCEEHVVLVDQSGLDGLRG